MQGYQECDLGLAKDSGIFIFKHCGTDGSQFPILPILPPHLPHQSLKSPHYYQIHR